MSVYKPKGSPFFQYDFWSGGFRFHGSTKEKIRRKAEQFETLERHRVEQEQKGHAPKAESKPEMTLNAATARFYQDHARHLAEGENVFGYCANLVRIMGKDTLLSEIGDAKTADFVSRRRGEPARHGGGLVSNRTVNIEVALIRRILRKAKLVWGVSVGEMPNFGEQFLEEDAPSERYLSAKEEADLFEHLRPDFHALTRFCIRTGARVTSARTLRWNQIDYDAAVITLKVKSRKKNKTQQIPLTQELLVLLANEKGKHPEFVFTYRCQKTVGAQQHGDKLIPARFKGKRYPFTRDGWRRAWMDALDKADIEGFTFHGLRHTAATRTLKSAGGNLKLVQKLLGHANLATTGRYAHVMIDDIREAMEAARPVVASPEKSPEVDQPAAAKSLAKQGKA